MFSCGITDPASVGKVPWFLKAFAPNLMGCCKAYQAAWPLLLPGLPGEYLVIKILCCTQAVPVSNIEFLSKLSGDTVRFEWKNPTFTPLKSSEVTLEFKNCFRISLSTEISLKSPNFQWNKEPELLWRYRADQRGATAFGTLAKTVTKAKPCI